MLSVHCRSALQAPVCDAQLRNPPELPGSVWRWTLPNSGCKFWCPHGEAEKSLSECQGTQGGVSWFEISLLRLLDKSWYRDDELQCQRDISRGACICIYAVIKTSHVLLLSLLEALTPGLLPQVEYCPCVVPGDCWNLMKEFMQSFLGPSVPELPSVFAAKPEGLFAPTDCIDTMTQYLELFNKLRKLQIPGTNVRWVCNKDICFFLSMFVQMLVYFWSYGSALVPRHFFFFFWTSGVLLSLQNFTLVLDESICNKETRWKQVVKVSERSYCDALLMVRFYLRVEAQSIHWFIASLHRDEPIYQLNTGPVDCQLIWWRLSVREVDFYLLHHPSFALAECLKMMSQAGERFSFLNNQISLFFSVRKTGMNELNVDYRSRNFIVSPIPRFMQLD